MKDIDYDNRNKNIFIEYYTTGKTFHTIAEEYGIGSQRVEVICKKYLRLMKYHLKHNKECDFQLVKKEQKNETTI